MFPYLKSIAFHVGNFPIHWFGILVAVGVVLGDRLVQTEGRRMGLDVRDVKYVNIRIVIGGFIMAHLVSTIFYFPERIRENPLVLLNIWSGLSSWGGFLGATLTYVYIVRRDKLPWRTFADAITLGLAVGWIFGRFGCYSAHDHPGGHTTFFLGVDYPDGRRHDLGLYEALYTALITPVLFWVSRASQRRGLVLGLFTVLYAPVRFAFDFLRETSAVQKVIERPDERYLGLTPAQYACIGGVAVGLWLMKTSRAEAVPELPSPPASAEG